MVYINGILDRIFTKFEEVGYKATNFTHKVAVSALAVGSVYGFYSLLSDYRTYFKSLKTAKYSETLQQRGRSIRKIFERRTTEG